MNQRAFSFIIDKNKLRKRIYYFSELICSFSTHIVTQMRFLVIDLSNKQQTLYNNNQRLAFSPIPQMLHLSLLLPTISNFNIAFHKAKAKPGRASEGSSGDCLSREHIHKELKIFSARVSQRYIDFSSTRSLARFMPASLT